MQNFSPLFLELLAVLLRAKIIIGGNITPELAFFFNFPFFCINNGCKLLAILFLRYFCYVVAPSTILGQLYMNMCLGRLITKESVNR